MAEPFISFVHPDDVDATLAVAARTPEPGGSAGIAFENRYRTRAGDYRLIDWTGVVEHGVMYFVAKDVTDRRATDIEQAQAASLARAITDSVTDGLLIADQDGAIVYVNPSGLTMLGFEGDELVGADRAATLREGETDDGSFARKDGSALPVVASSSPVPLASGVGSVITFRDISAQLAASTARDEAEAGVRRLDELHRTLTANLPDTTVFLLDLDLRILIADGEAIRRLPWFDEAHFRGRLVPSWTALFHRAPRPTAQRRRRARSLRARERCSGCRRRSRASMGRSRAWPIWSRRSGTASGCWAIEHKRESIGIRPSGNLRADAVETRVREVGDPGYG